MNRLRQLLPTVLVSVAVVVVVTLLAPPAVQAAGRTYVTLRDPSNNTGAGLAKVVGGKLAVTDGSGALTVDGTVTAKPPTRTGFAATCVRDYHDDSSDEVCAVEGVPAGKRLVIQSISALITLPQRSDLRGYLAYTVGGTPQRMHLPKTLDTTFERSSGSYYNTYSATLTGLEIITDAGTPRALVVDRNELNDVIVACEITINGYLE